MYELGREEVKFHREVGEFAVISGLDLLVTVGELGAEIAQGALQVGMPAANVVSCPTSAEAILRLQEILSSPDNAQPVILVKASRGMQLEQVVEGIRNLC
jgi:UDP-N-acetylmuramoyl-tripeptide--D-alanyl-D-alanine ligase